MTKYYEVCAKCGHVGKGKYVYKVFAVIAESGKQAAGLARDIPRVKHHASDAIKYVREIDYDRYLEIISINDADPYFKCECVQDQRAYCEMEIHDEPERGGRVRSEKPVKNVYRGKKRLRNPKKYINRIHAGGGEVT